MDQAAGATEVGLNELLTAPKNIGKVFNLDTITMIDALREAEKTGAVKIIRTAGLDVVRIDKSYTFNECVEKYYENIEKGREKSMTNMISVATGFQSSVNIAYDMNDDGKLKNYIPTKSALSLLEDVLLSTSQNSTDRARILIGAYGKGKSHIVLMILSILMKKDPELFEKMMPVISSEKPELYQLIQNYYHGSNKILPVVISGSSNSLAQAFLLALERTLAENELTDIMPETNYQAAINTIVKVATSCQ